MKKRLLAGLLTTIMVMTMMPVAALAANSTALNPGDVQAAKGLVSQTPDADGNYTIQLSVKGEPKEVSNASTADVVLVVDNSGSMASSVGEPCSATKKDIEDNGFLIHTCPKCGALYLWPFIPDKCEGETGSESRIQTAKAVGKEFAQNILKEGDNRIAVIGFSHNSNKGGANDTKANKVVQPLTKQVGEAVSSIEKMKADGGTNYSAALKQAADWLSARPEAEKTRPSYVVFISDGAPGLQGESIKDINWNGSVQAKALKDAGTTMYTIGISLKDAEGAYLKSLATDAQDYMNVTGKDYADKLKDVLSKWAGEIKTVPAGTEAKMVDTINTDAFELVAGSITDKNLTVDEDGKTLTWNIGDIPKDDAFVTFKVKPKAGAFGELHTNADVKLTYKDSAGKAVEVAKDEIGDPTVTVQKPEEPAEYSVTYSYDKSVPAEVMATLPTNNYTYSVGQKVTTAAKPDDVAVGDYIWKFQTWQLNGVNVAPNTQVAMVKGGLNFTGVWTCEAVKPAEYSVTYSYDKSVPAEVMATLPTNNYTYSVGQKVTTAAKPDDVAVGDYIWKFQTWQLNGVNVAPNTQVEMVKGGLTFTGVWTREAVKPAEYTVTFNNGTSEYAKVTVKASESVALKMPSAPTREGYTFAGWNIEADGSGDEFAATTIVNADMTVWAQWTKNETPAGKTLKIYWAADNHAVFKDNGKDSWTETISWNDRENTFVLPELTIEDGYELKGWAVSGKESNYWDAAAKTFGLTGLIVEDDEGGYVSITANIVKKDAEQQKINVHFYIANLNGGYYTVDGEQVTSHDVQANDKVAFPELTVNDGYELKGWQVDGKYSAVWDADSKEAIGIEGLASDSGDLAITPILVKKDSPVDPDGTINVHFYLANWESGDYIVNGESVKYYDVAVAAAEDKVVFPELKVAAGYELTGWQVEGKATTAMAKDIKELSGLAALANDGHVAIRPVIVKEGETGESFTVTFDSQGGSNVASQTVKRGEKVEQPSDPTRSGYSFQGWYEEAECKNAWNFTTDTVTRNMTLYADWSKKSSGGSSSSTTYKITASADDNGSITPSGNTYVNRGSDKTFTITADKNYVVKDVFVDGKSVGAVSKYVFEDVRATHTIRATFARKGAVADPDDTGVSAKLDTENHMKYMVGYPDGTFGPSRNMTRAEVAQMFYNLLLDKKTSGNVRFTDVKDDAWYATAVRTLAGMGVINGYGDGRFQPGKSITRAEFTAMSMRFAKSDASGQNIFSDVNKGAWYYDAVVGSVAYGWVNGYGDGTFRSNDTITRAEVVTIVNNMLGRSADQEYVDSHSSTIEKFTDLKDSHWAYYNIMEATNAHNYDKKDSVEDWTKLK